MSHRNESDWTEAQRSLSVAGIVLMTFALERLASAALRGTPDGARTALGFSLAFALIGAAVLGVVLVMRRVGKLRKPLDSTAGWPAGPPET